MTLAEILASGRAGADGIDFAIPAGWMQGRTCYGGLSATLALVAARACAADLPPLRSAQIAYVGPLAGEVRATATLLRRGRNAAFIQSDVVGAAGLGLRATFVFMGAVPSSIAHDARARIDRPLPAPGTPLWSGPEGMFAHHYEFLDLKDDALGPADLLRWGRLKQWGGLDPALHLLAIGDALPPAAIRLLGDGRAPMSSLNWQINLLDPLAATRDGWWLLSSRSAYAVGGNSGQAMAIHNADGVLVAEGMQSVALFG